MDTFLQQDKIVENAAGPVHYKNIMKVLIIRLRHNIQLSNRSFCQAMIFSDRVEIINPGKLANSLTIEKIKNGLSIARNPIFHSFAPFVQNYSGFGTGIDRIFSHCPDTEFINDISGEEFRVIFKRNIKKNNGNT